MKEGVENEKSFFTPSFMYDKNLLLLIPIFQNQSAYRIKSA